MAKQIFLLYSVNNWDRDAKLIYAGTSVRKLKSVIINEIREGNMTYDTGEELPVNKQIKLFKEHWKTNSRDAINDNLNYGYYDYTTNDDMI